MKPSEILRIAKARIPTPEVWWRGHGPSDGKFCVLSAIGPQHGQLWSDEFSKAKDYYRLAVNFPVDKSPPFGGPLDIWNDLQATFDALHTGFDKAIELAEVEGQ